MPQSFGSLHCHLVFSTKNRQPQIQGDWEDRLYQYLGGILRSESQCLVAAGGMPDHIHLLISMSRTANVADVVRILKSNSSSWVRNTLGISNFQWQAGYGAFAVSYSHLDDVKRYISNQKQHHEQMSFKQEFLELLTRHDIQSDEKYIWE